MSVEDLHTDGNALAGVLAELFGGGRVGCPAAL